MAEAVGDPSRRSLTWVRKGIDEIFGLLFLWAHGGLLAFMHGVPSERDIWEQSGHTSLNSLATITTIVLLGTAATHLSFAGNFVCDIRRERRGLAQDTPNAPLYRRLLIPPFFVGVLVRYLWREALFCPQLRYASEGARHD